VKRRAAACETTLARVGRRAITIPLFLLLGPLFVAALPIALPLPALHDALRRTRWSGVRSALALAHDAVGETLGLLAAAELWIVGRFAPRRAADRTFRLQCWWARVDAWLEARSRAEGGAA
jgi:hypothetical protein